MKLRNFVLLSASVTALMAGSALDHRNPANATDSVVPQDSDGGSIITLYAGDETRCSVDLVSGGYGSSVVGGLVNLDGSHLLWNLLDPGKLSIGYGRNQSARVVDLGESYVRPPNDPRSNSPLIPTSIFHSLRFDGKNVVHDAPGRRAVQSSEGRRVTTLPAQIRTTHFEPIAGHTYMVKLQPGGVGSREVIFAKFHIIDIQPNHTLTLQCARMGG